MARNLSFITMQLIISIILIKSFLPRWVDLTDRPPFERSTHGSCNSCSVPYWCPCQKEPWWIQGGKNSQYFLSASIDLNVSFISLVQSIADSIFCSGLYFPCSLKTIPHRNLFLHWFPGEFIKPIPSDTGDFKTHLKLQCCSGLHLLLCACTLALCETAQASPELSTPRGPRGKTCHCALGTNDDNYTYLQQVFSVCPMPISYGILYEKKL